MRETTQHSITNLSRAVKRIVGIVALTLIGVLFLPAQNSTPPQPPKAGRPPVSQSAVALPPIQLDESAVLYHLNQLINWYRHSTTGDPARRIAQRRHLSGQCQESRALRSCGSHSSRRKPRPQCLRLSRKEARCSQPSDGIDATAEPAPDAGQDFFPDRSIAVADRISEPTDRQNTEPPVGAS